VSTHFSYHSDCSDVIIYILESAIYVTTELPSLEVGLGHIILVTRLLLPCLEPIEHLALFLVVEMTFRLNGIHRRRPPTATGHRSIKHVEDSTRGLIPLKETKYASPFLQSR